MKSIVSICCSLSWEWAALGIVMVPSDFVEWEEDNLNNRKPIHSTVARFLNLLILWYEKGKNISEKTIEGTAGPLLPENSQHPTLLQHVDKLHPNPSPQVWNGGCYVTHDYPTELIVEVELAFQYPFHNANLKKFLQFKFHWPWCSDKAFLLSRTSVSRGNY